MITEAQEAEEMSTERPRCGRATEWHMQSGNGERHPDTEERPQAHRKTPEWETINTGKRQSGPSWHSSSKSLKRARKEAPAPLRV